MLCHNAINWIPLYVFPPLLQFQANFTSNGSIKFHSLPSRAHQAPVAEMQAAVMCSKRGAWWMEQGLNQPLMVTQHWLCSTAAQSIKPVIQQSEVFFFGLFVFFKLFSFVLVKYLWEFCCKYYSYLYTWIMLEQLMRFFHFAGFCSHHK